MIDVRAQTTAALRRTDHGGSGLRGRGRSAAGEPNATVASIPMVQNGNNHCVNELESSRNTRLVGGGDHEMSPSLACSHVSFAGGDLLLEGHLPHRRYDTQSGKSGVVAQDTGRFLRSRRLEKLAPAHRSGASCSLGDASRGSSRLAPRIYRAFQRGRPGAPHSRKGTVEKGE